MSDFIAKEREGSLATIAGLRATLSCCWRSACEFDNIDPAALFVVFSDGNPFAPFVDRCGQQLAQAVADFNSFGYVGLQIKDGAAKLPGTKKRAGRKAPGRTDRG